MTSSSNDKEDFRLMLERLKDSLDPRYFLESLGFDTSRETAKEIRSSCKIHGGDNKTSFRFNKETRTWVCFSHRCHEVFGNDIIGLVKGCMGVDFMAAVQYLRSLAGDLGDDNYLDYKRKKEQEAFVKSRKKAKAKSSIVTDACLEQFKPFRSSYFSKQGFKKETLDFFEIAGGYTDSYGYIRDIISIRDDKGVLVGYSMRDIRENVDDDDFKYILTPGFDKDKVMYNLCNAKNHIENKPLIVVEGFKSVWRLHELGIKNVVASMGAHITSGQQNLLFTYAKNGIVIFFDGDGPGISGAVRMVEELRGKINVDTIIIVEEGKDPADLDENTLRSYLNNYI